MLRLVKVTVLVSILMVAVLALSGCAAIITSAEGGPSEPVVEEVPAVEDGSMRPIAVQHVQVEVGIGSPIPVDVVVSGEWPGLCAQLAQVTMARGDFDFEYELLATPEETGCPPDMLGLPFLLRIPLNVVELAEGTYTVSVNGVEATFEVPVAVPAGP